MSIPSDEFPVIRLDELSYIYPGPPPVIALKSLNLSVSRGEHVAIVGPSGSGKTTLLNLLGLLDRATEGRVEVDGQDMNAASERVRSGVRARRIGFVFQSFHLLPFRTATENVMLAQVYADVPRRHRLRAAIAALEQVGLAHRVNALPTAMSGGERQRVAIARALVNRPALLLCDEPSGNLDQAATADLLNVLEDLNRSGVTLLVITHNPDVAARANRRLVMRDGRLSDELG
jgi:putative ABC transport system ATP-binding protein